MIGAIAAVPALGQSSNDQSGRELQRQLKEEGIAIVNAVGETTKGPTGFLVIDPDGNPILIDPHV